VKIRGVGVRSVGVTATNFVDTKQESFIGLTKTTKQGSSRLRTRVDPPLAHGSSVGERRTGRDDRASSMRRLMRSSWARRAARSSSRWTRSAWRSVRRSSRSSYTHESPPVRLSTTSKKEQKSYSRPYGAAPRGSARGPAPAAGARSGRERAVQKGMRPDNELN